MADIADLAKALVALQGDLEAVGKTAINPFFKSMYADLPTVMQAVQPLLKKHKLAVSQFITNIDGQSALRTILLHESGQTIEDVMPLLLQKSDPQGQGSAITYARRYSFMAVLGVVADEDDDGNKASNAKTTENMSRQKEMVDNVNSVMIGKPTLKQINTIWALGKKAGIDDEQISARIKTLTSPKEASEAIDKLNQLVAEGEG